MRFKSWFGFLSIHFLFFSPFALIANTSKENRIRKDVSYEFTIGFRGFKVYEVIASYSKYLQDNGDIYSFAIHKISKKIVEKNKPSGGTWELDGYGLSSSFRYFTGNSFFLESSAILETYRSWQPINKSYSERINYGNASRLAFSAQFGNQWQWEHSNLGITWLGGVFPILKSENYQTTDHSFGTFPNFIQSNSTLFLRISYGWAL